MAGGRARQERAINGAGRLGERDGNLFERARPHNDDAARPGAPAWRGGVM